MLLGGKTVKYREYAAKEMRNGVKRMHTEGLEGIDVQFSLRAIG